MIKKETIQYWIDISDYDLETAEAMLQSQRYLYVGFMCHQSIEKIFKAYFCKNTGENAPYIHSLSSLAKQGNFFDSLTDEQISFLDQLEPLNIEARYPSYRERLLKSLTVVKCLEILTATRNLQEWIKSKL